MSPRLFLRLAVLIAPLSLLSCHSRSGPDLPKTSPQSGARQGVPIGEADQQACVQAARQVLGESAELLKCGHLSDADHLEAVAGTRVAGMKDDRNGVPVSKLIILRRSQSAWNTELRVDEEITNPAGYVGCDFIDDSHPFPYYRVDIAAQWGAPDPSKFTLVLLSMTRGGRVDPEELGIGIGWNPAVERFQEIDPNGEQFVPEVKAPRHIRSSR